MKKFFLPLLLLAFVQMAMAQESVTSFPRKHLIEHFTGEACGYCPYGMDGIQEFLAKTTKDYIWVGHHYGYGTDEYTIPANSTIGKKLGVSGAPNVVIDRTKRKVNGNNAYAFHPAYLPETGAVPLNDADTSLVSVVVAPDYNAATRQLTVVVSGQVLSTDTILLLSVLIKESGMLGEQHDYYGSWEGWLEFRHVKTVRAMLTAAMGDKVKVVDGIYSDTLTYTVPAAWVDTNCTVVAYVTANSTLVKPILNAEQAPMVAGTTGGEDLIAEGITPTPVSDTYPESGSPIANINFSSCNVNADNLTANGYLIVTLQSTQTAIYDGYRCTPYCQLFVFSRSRTLAAGTYPFVQSGYQYGTIAAGYRDDEAFDIGGSVLHYVYNQNGQLYSMGEWLLIQGEMVVDAAGNITLNATTLNGSKVQGSYTIPGSSSMQGIHDVHSINSAAKALRGNELLIERNGVFYNVQGVIRK